MPHFCDDCGHEFSSGSDEMLSGCPDCGGRKFQYVAEGSAPPTQDTQSSSGETADSDIIEAGPSTPSDDGPEDSAQHAARSGMINPDEGESSYAGSVSDLVSGLQSAGGDGGAESDDPGEGDSGSDSEQTVSSEACDTEQTSSEESGEDSVDDEDDADVEPSRRVTTTDDLRAELEEQFESIKIREPGSYELNLKKLYEREEHIIQIKENGKYVIQMPER